MKKPAQPSARGRGLSAADLRAAALAFPGIGEGTSHGRPSFLFGKKFFTRLRSEDNSVVLVVDSIDERDMLIESDPALFHITEHYRNYPAVLARMSHLDATLLRGMLERRWRAMAPKKSLRLFAEKKDGADPELRGTRKIQEVRRKEHKERKR